MNPLTTLRKALSATPTAVGMFRGFGGAFFAYPRSQFIDDAFIVSQQATYAAIYEKQPNVRIVVDKISNIAADRTLRFFEHDGDQGIEDGDHPAAQTMRRPNDWQGQKEVLVAIIRDLLIYDNAYFWDFGRVENDRRYLVRVPPHAMGKRHPVSTLHPTGYRVRFADGTWIDLEPVEVIHFRGYSALDPREGTSPMETLRTMLVEESVRQAQTIESVKGGLVKGGIIKRPADAPEWSQEAMERFSESFADRLRGVIKGRTPVLEEGMEFEEAGITPREAEMLANRRFALETVANIYGVHPSVFQAQGNLAMGRAAMEEDVIVPLCGRVAETLTRQLVHGIYQDDDCYFQFRPRRESDLQKLMQAGSTGTGGAVMAPNEFRDEFLGLPPKPGGDELVSHPGAVNANNPPAPGEPARGRPTAPAEDSLAQEEKAVREARDKLASVAAEAEAVLVAEEQKTLVRRQEAFKRRDRAAAEHAEVLRNHFARQLASFDGGKADINFDSPRWNNELKADLLRLARELVSSEGAMQAERLMGRFDDSQVQHYLERGAELTAKNINADTTDSIRMASTKDTAEAVQRVLGDSDERAEGLGNSRATALMAFSALEAGKQTQGPGQLRLKSWVGSGSPQSRHTQVSGSNVPLFNAFQNGLQFPGDPKGPAHETANCKCLMEVN